MRSLQLVVHNHWNFEDETVVVTWNPSNELDLLWRSDVHHLFRGVSLETPHPDLLFWSNVLDQGWGANLLDDFVSGRWSAEERTFSMNLREPRAICLGLYHFCHLLRGQTVGVLSDNTTALSYIRKHGRGDVFCCSQQRGSTPSPLGRVVGNFSDATVYHGGEECCRPFHESSPAGSGLRVDPCSGCGGRVAGKVASDGRPLCHCPQLPAPSAFFTQNYPMAPGMDAFLQEWDGLQAYAFPPFALIRHVLNKLHSCKGILLTLIAPFWPQKEWFLELLSLSVATPVPLPSQRDLLRQPHFHCLHQNLHLLWLHVW